MRARRRSEFASQTAQLARLTRFAIVALCAGCVGPFAPCSEAGKFGLYVTVVDSTTSGPPTSQPTLIIVDGTFADTVVGFAPGERPVSVIPAAGERPGTYSLAVTAAGYRRWTRDGVGVREGGRCDDVQTVRLTARMQLGAEPSAE